jgi:hypothetical protein
MPAPPSKRRKSLVALLQHEALKKEEQRLQAFFSMAEHRLPPPSARPGFSGPGSRRGPSRSSERSMFHRRSLIRRKAQEQERAHLLLLGITTAGLGVIRLRTLTPNRRSTVTPAGKAKP